jgi:hypothetical protein
MRVIKYVRKIVRLPIPILVLGLVGTLLLVSVGVYAFSKYVPQANLLCSGDLMCHYMKPYHISASKTVHKDQNCHVCHEVKDFLDFYRIITTEMWTAVTEMPDRVTVRAHVPSRMCLNCHEMHLMEGHEECVVCHMGHVEI